MPAGLDCNLMGCVNISKKGIYLTECRAGREEVRSNYKSTNWLSPFSRTVQEGKMPLYIQDTKCLCHKKLESPRMVYPYSLETDTLQTYVRLKSYNSHCSIPRSPTDF